MRALFDICVTVSTVSALNTVNQPPISIILTIHQASSRLKRLLPILTHIAWVLHTRTLRCAERHMYSMYSSYTYPTMHGNAICLNIEHGLCCIQDFLKSSTLLTQMYRGVSRMTCMDLISQDIASDGVLISWSQHQKTADHVFRGVDNKITRSCYSIKEDRRNYSRKWIQDFHMFISGEKYWLTAQGRHFLRHGGACLPQFLPCTHSNKLKEQQPVLQQVTFFSLGFTSQATYTPPYLMGGGCWGHTWGQPERKTAVTQG